MVELPTRTVFEVHRGTKFRLEEEPGSALELELVEVTMMRGASDPRGRPFSLLFRGPAAPLLPQRIYAMEHERLGRLEIFIVPIGRDAAGVRYEAVFN
ncbi:MAG TPA: hypothetical protein VMS17_33065 [Gemmataceae bacterium]|nr:hypothetical protein [Gemmataceae bacterium]